ncbi:MAG: hypothetical protein H6575_03165 [Lewinellaceae bacterium]|nr:hypothetical protein [Lewinellaceae bacterium]
MHKLKFLVLLRTLDEIEISAFHRYLKRMHGNEQTALSLFTYILKSAPDFSDEKRLNMSYAYRKIFREDIGEKRKKILNTLSDLYMWLKTFLLFQKATAPSIEHEALWLSVLYEHGMEAEFSKQLHALQQKKDASPVKSVTDCLKHVAVNHFAYYHQVHDSLDSDSRALRQYEKSLDLFYAIAKLKTACEVANRKNVLAIDVGSMNLAASTEMQLPGNHDHPLLLLYSEVYRLLAYGQEDSFERGKTMLIKHATMLDPSEIHRLLSYLTNFASARIRDGQKNYWLETHELNKLGVQYAAFLREDGMSVTQFNNIVSVACNLGDVDWADFFVKTQGKFLPESLQEDATLLAKATIHFKKGQYLQVLKTLRKKNFESLLDNIRAKALTLKSYYEMEDADVLDKCLVFDAYLSRHNRRKIEAVAASLHFSKILKAIIRRNLPAQQILSDIKDTQPLYFREWLLEKMIDYRKT